MKIIFINGISYKESRTSFTQFTPSYFEIPNVIFSRKGEFNDYIGLSSLKGKKVGITKDIYYYDKVKDLKLFEIVEFEVWEFRNFESLNLWNSWKFRALGF